MSADRVLGRFQAGVEMVIKPVAVSRIPIRSISILKMEASRKPTCRKKRSILNMPMLHGRILLSKWDCKTGMLKMSSSFIWNPFVNFSSVQKVKQNHNRQKLTENESKIALIRYQFGIPLLRGQILMRKNFLITR